MNTRSPSLFSVPVLFSFSNELSRARSIQRNRETKPTNDPRNPAEQGPSKRDRARMGPSQDIYPRELVLTTPAEQPQPNPSQRTEQKIKKPCRVQGNLATPALHQLLKPSKEPTNEPRNSSANKIKCLCAHTGSHRTRMNSTSENSQPQPSRTPAR